MKFFEIYADTCVEDFIKLDENIFGEDFERACHFSEFQYLDKKNIEVEISLDGGIYFPDFMVHNEVIPLVSAKMRKIFDAADIDNIFYKPVTLTLNKLGLSENYFLALPPRINCLNLSESLIEIEDENFFSEMALKTVNKIVIDDKKIGNYKIFKLPPFFTNTEIIVTEDFKNFLENKNLSNVNFLEI